MIANLQLDRRSSLGALASLPIIIATKLLAYVRGSTVASTDDVGYLMDGRISGGVEALPVELLMTIVEEAYRSTTVGRREPLAVNLSHVSKRFRGISLSLPEVWTELNAGRHTLVLRKFLSRSGDADFTLCCDTLLGLVAAAPVIMPQQSRLTGLRVFSELDGTHDEIQARVVAGCRDMELTALDTLCIHYADSRPLELKMREDFSNPVLFYTSWSLPMLRHLKAENVFPVPMLGSNLTSFTFIVDIDPRYDDEGWNLAGFSQALVNMPHCKALTLEYLRPGGIGSSGFSPDVVLPALETLTIKSSSIIDDIGLSTGRLCMPRLARIDLDLRIRSHQGDSLSAMLQAVATHSNQNFRNLRELRIVASPLDPSLPAKGVARLDSLASSMHDISTRFPDLQHLSIKVAGLYMVDPDFHRSAWEANAFRALTTLRLEDCGPHSIRFLVRLIHGLSLNLRRIHIKDWRGFDLQLLRELLDGVEVVSDD